MDITIGERIKNIRKANGYTQKQLSEKINITVPTLSRWENNQRKPQYHYIVRIVKEFNISISELVKEENYVHRHGSTIIFIEHYDSLIKICNNCNRFVSIESNYCQICGSDLKPEVTRKGKLELV